MNFHITKTLKRRVLRKVFHTKPLATHENFNDDVFEWFCKNVVKYIIRNGNFPKLQGCLFCQLNYIFTCIYYFVIYIFVNFLFSFNFDYFWKVICNELKILNCSLILKVGKFKIIYKKSEF